MTKFACLSDTHCKMDAGAIIIPPCDVVLHAGDFSFRGELPECLKELDILREKSLAAGAQAIVVTAGNHDWIYQFHPEMMKDECRKRNIHLLLHDAMLLKMGERDFKIFGSAYQPEFFNWAFNVPRGPALAAKWAEIPDDTEILISHGPPHLILDKIPDSYVKHGGPNRTANVGCEDLAQRITELKKLKLHVFGHIHHSYGQVEAMGVKFVNASNCTERYVPINPVQVVEIT
jgi:predicted phosphohydrolase